MAFCSSGSLLRANFSIVSLPFLYTVIVSGVNPAGDREDTSPKKCRMGTVMHHVPQIWRRFRCIVTGRGSFLNSAQCFGIIVQLQPVVKSLGLFS